MPRVDILAPTDLGARGAAVLVRWMKHLVCVALALPVTTACKYLAPDSPSADTPDRETTALELFLTQLELGWATANRTSRPVLDLNGQMTLGN